MWNSMRFSWILVCALTLAAQDRPGRFIVELDVEPALAMSKSERSAAGSGERLARVQRQQESVRRVLAEKKLPVVGSVDTVANAIIVEGGDIAELRALPGVKRVQQARYVRKMLDRAIPLMRISDAWSQVGGITKAGIGMKIGIIDTGIDQWHLGFQDNSLPIPEGYPKVSSERDRALTNNKVIVARTYDGTTAADREGHGTSVAMVAAGVLHDGNRPGMSGVAPKAYLGNYRVAGPDGSLSSDSILRAIDDAVKDGMDVLNVSLGGPSISPTDEDIVNVALQRAYAAGVVVTVAAGNEGPDMQTVNDIGSVDAAISVGSTRNDRVPTNPALILSSGTRILATVSTNSDDVPAITGQMVDVSSIDSTGLGCSPLTRGSVAGKIAFIMRGTCNFEEKVNNAEAGGAIGVVVYNNVASPLRVGMEVGAANLKSFMISRADGLRVKDLIAAQPDQQVTLQFTSSIPDDSNVLSSFSSRGPTIEQRLKPDLLAVGSSIWSATNGTPAGNPEASSYTNASGTSFSSPMVAGAAAVLKAGRPGLTAAQYRSLLINSADPFPDGKDDRSLLQTGAGRLNLRAALTSNTTVEPTSISFGEVAAQNPQAVKEFTLTNVGVEAATVEFTVESINPLKPSLSATSLALSAKGSGKVTLRWTNIGPPAGEYQGFVVARDSNGGVTRIPYWLGVRSGTPKAISLIWIQDLDGRGRTYDVLFRVLDGSNLPVTGMVPAASVISGGSAEGVAGIQNSSGAFVATVTIALGSESGDFKLSVGTVERQFTCYTTIGTCR